MSIPDEDGEGRGEKGRKWGEVGSFCPEWRGR
jgi:hypothetical protein